MDMETSVVSHGRDADGCWDGFCGPAFYCKPYVDSYA